MHSTLLFMLIIGSILAVYPLPMNEVHDSGSSKVQLSGSKPVTVITVSFLDPKTGERGSRPCQLPTSKKVRQALNDAITNAWNVKSTDFVLVAYYGVFNPLEHGQIKIAYFEVIGEKKCQNICLGWIVVDGVYSHGHNDEDHTSKTDSRKTLYYAGISSGMQFKGMGEDECVGINPLIAHNKGVAQNRWYTYRDAAHSSFPLTVVHPPVVTFMTLQGTSQHKDPVDTGFTRAITKVILEIFKISCSVTYYGPPDVDIADQHRLVYFKFVGGNLGPICTHNKPCFGWTGIGASIGPGQSEPKNSRDKFTRRYLAIYSQKSPPEGTTRFQLQRVYPVVDEANPHNGPTSMEFLDMSEQFVKKFVIPPEDRESPPLTEGKRGPYNVKSGRKEGRKEAGSGSQPLTKKRKPS